MSPRAMGFTVGTLVVLLALPVRANEPGPSLEEVLRRSTAVALGWVEQVDGRSGHPVVSLRIEHVARGELPDLVTISADVSDVTGIDPSLSIGARLLVFLEPAQGEPGTQPAFRAAASLSVFSRKGVAHVAPGSSRPVSLPPALCEPGLRYYGSKCAARLDRLLQRAGLKPYTRSHKGATYRVSLPPECPPCTLEDEVAKHWGSSGIDCGSATDDEVRPRILRCVQEALQQHKAFKVIVPRRGIDSAIVSAFVSDGTRIHEFGFDSSTLGGPRCSALVERHSCQTLDFGKGPGAWPQCGKRGGAEILCSQLQSGVRRLTPPEEVSRLRCAEIRQGGRYDSCEVAPSGPSGKNIVPPSDGPNLHCASLDGTLRCWPDD